jgi:AcrR family transcriptional regulator
MAMARTGRRPGKGDTRGQVLTAARAEFAARGYRGATVRGIAAKAEVDPALVHHYFGTKRDLFVETIQLPFDPDKVAAAAVDGDPAAAGERIVRVLLGVWATDEGRALMQSLLRSAVTDDELLALLREFMFETVVLPIATAVATDNVPLRANLPASQVIGLAFIRHVAEVEPLASAEIETVVSAVAPTLQRYLTGELGSS